MLVTINGKEKELTEAVSLFDTISQFCKNTDHVISELNGKIIKSDLWPQTELKSGDKIELITFVGGG